MLVFSFCFWQAMKYFKCPPPARPPSLDSLVNPASYSLSRPIIFHSHSHFWIGSSKESPPETNEFMSVHKQSHAHCAQLRLRGPGLDSNMKVFLFIYFSVKSFYWNMQLPLKYRSSIGVLTKTGEGAGPISVWDWKSKWAGRDRPVSLYYGVSVQK